ncbi:hypothetical protein SELMODRAFT_449561 [Selaginella moellendorffii]|uniref:F-box domain-containing protein n=1 Tax=Selaginella moellendorffii TaxID=88036 RepID=D8RDI1_SELML|nr:hypothetical protein SELMODRAFT_449561 [Selaginella moellendorffii]
MDLLPDLDLFDTSTEQRRDAGLTKEDVERCIVDENVGELDRLKMFLSPTAHQLQQSCAVAKLPTTFQEYGLRAYHALIPTINSSLERFNAQMQVAVGEAVNRIIQNGTFTKDVVGRLLPTIMTMLTSTRPDAVVYAWLEALCSLVPFLPRKVLTESLLKLALSKGQPDESSQTKILCARIYGSTAPSLEGKYVEQTFLQKAMALCQDTDSEVRVCMCRQLYPLSRTVGLDTAERVVLPELCELLRDEEIPVQHASLKCLLEMLSMFPPETKQLKIFPIIRSCAQHFHFWFCVQQESEMLLSLLPFLGEILVKMGPELKEEDVQVLVDSFRLFCSHEDENIRRITKMLGKDKTSLYLKEPLILLLKDTSREVQGSLLPILQHVLGIYWFLTGQFSSSGEHQRLATYGAIIPYLLQMEKAISSTHQWRLQLDLLNAFPQLPDYVSSDQIFEYFVPICFRYMSDGALPVRSAATLSLAIFIRTSSSQMFKEHFLESAIVVLQDAVASVRMRACLLIPLLKAAIKLPDDVQALERINFFATQRLNDNDRHVASVARSIADCLKHANIRLPGNEKFSQAEFEAIDKQKEEEEWNMLSKEEQDEKRKLDDVLHRMKLEPHKRTGHATGTSTARMPSKVTGSPSVKVKAAAPGVLSSGGKQKSPPAATAPGSVKAPNSARLESESESSDVFSLPQARPQSKAKAGGYATAMIQWKRTLRNVPGIRGLASRVGGDAINHPGASSSSEDSALQRAWDAVVDTWNFITRKARAMGDASDPFDKLPDEVYQLIFHAICDCKSLVRCMAVSRAFKEQSERVSTLCIVCPGQFTSYVDKLQRIFMMVRRFHSLEALVVRVGQPKDEPPSWARCMRYAEIGSFVEKFIFMAAKIGEFSEFDSALRGHPVHRKERESSSEGEGEAVRMDRDSVTSGGNSSTTRSPLDEEEKEDEDCSWPLSDEQIYPQLILRQVVAPSNDVLKRMVPVIVFAIVQGLDEFRDSVPAFVHKFKKLKMFLLVDMLESVTVLMREHHIQQIRIRQQQVDDSKDVKGKSVNAGEECSSDLMQKGKEWLESDENRACSSRRKQDQGESSGSQGNYEDEEDNEEELSHSSEGCATTLEGGDNQRTPFDDASETWRNCKGICIHGPGDSRGELAFKYPFKRTGRGTRDNRSVRIGSYRRRERSAEWMDESVRRRQESRHYKGLSLRRREESRAFKTWKLGKRERENGDGDGSYSAQSVLESSCASSSSHADSGSYASGETSDGVSASLDHPLASSCPAEGATRDYHMGERLSHGNMEAWSETWNERLGRRARELPREMGGNESATDVGREALRRERLREGVRKRQMEIEREALRFDITFWRADEVVARSNYSLTDVSMCIATHDASPLSISESKTLVCSALAGPLLAATIAHVNEQASFHNL